MQNKKHKIFLYPLEENDKVRVFLFQSGERTGDSVNGRVFTAINGACIAQYDFPQFGHGQSVFINGNYKDRNYRIYYTIIEKEKFQKLKELENEYNNREE